MLIKQSPPATRKHLLVSKRLFRHNGFSGIWWAGSSEDYLHEHFLQAANTEPKTQAIDQRIWISEKAPSAFSQVQNNARLCRARHSK